MRNSFRLKDIVVKKNRIEYGYEVSGTWKKYFNMSEKLYVEYNVDIEKVTRSIAVIPLLCMILPISWLCDADIVVDELDSVFYENIENIKKGYQDMYPMLRFSGGIRGRIIENFQLNSEASSAAFFSGGVDAFHTLIRHLNEQPVLLTVWGADIKLDDTQGWKCVKEHVESVGSEFGLRNIYIKSNFRSAIFERNLSRLVRKSGDGWWHGFYCGIGIIGLASVCAYKLGLENLYIASSFPEFMKGQYTCGSDPTIDNYINFCGCRTRHDGYEYDRQNKVRELSRYIKEQEQNLKIRVCWSSSGGGNCCECEKCYRTIMEFVSEGIDPNTIGFLWNTEKKELFKKNMINSIIISESDWRIKWDPIKKRLLENQKSCKEYSWLINMSYDEFMSSPTKKIKQTILYRILLRVKRKVRFH